MPSPGMRYATWRLRIARKKIHGANFATEEERGERACWDAAQRSWQEEGVSFHMRKQEVFQRRPLLVMLVDSLPHFSTSRTFPQPAPALGRGRPRGGEEDSHVALHFSHLAATI